MFVGGGREAEVSADQHGANTREHINCEGFRIAVKIGDTKTACAVIDGEARIANALTIWQENDDRVWCSREVGPQECPRRNSIPSLDWRPCPINLPDSLHMPCNPSGWCCG